MKKRMLLSFIFILFISFGIYGQYVQKYAGLPMQKGINGIGITKDSALFAYPYGLAFDSKGNLWITNQGGDYDSMGNTGHTIGVITPDGNYYTRAGSYGNPCLKDGAGLGGALFNFPSGISVGPGDTIYVADMGNSVIRKIAPLNGLQNSQLTYIFAGKYSYITPYQPCYSTYPGYADGPAMTAQFDEPIDLDLDAAGNVYVADKNNHCIRKITPAGYVTTIAGIPGQPGNVDGNALGQAKFNNPVGIFVDNNNDIYVSEWGNNQIRKISGNTVSTYMKNTDTTWLWLPMDIFKDAYGAMYICNAFRVLKRAGGKTSLFAGSTIHNEFGYKNGIDTAARFNGLRQVVVDPNDNHFVYVSDMDNHLIRKVTICEPYKPSIFHSGNLNTCTGDTVILTADNGYLNYYWSTGATGKQIKVYGKGSHSIALTTVNQDQCKGTSDSVRIEISDLFPVVQASGSLTFCVGGSVSLIGPNGMDYYYWTKNGSLYEEGANKQTIVVTTSGTYQLRGTKGPCTGNSASFIVNVTDHIIPQVAVISGDTFLCPGQSVTLQTVNPYNSYTWKKNGSEVIGSSRTITLSNTGSYSVYVDAGSGCTGTSFPINVVVNPAPPKPTISKFQDSFLMSSSATNNQWYRNLTIIAGATSQVYFPKQSGNYSVEVSNQYGCKSMSDLYPVGDSVSAPDFLTRNRLSLYPNPSAGQLFIKGSMINSGNMELAVINILGEIRWNTHIKTCQGYLNSTLNLADLEDGFYYIRLRMNNEEGILKFILQR